MIFQGQEFSASSPFFFFADHAAQLAALVRVGRREFLHQFPSVASLDDDWLPDPADVATFERSKLDLREREQHAEAYALHRDLLRLRHSDHVFGEQRPGGVDGAVLGAQAFALRFFGAHGDDRLLLVNLGVELRLQIAPEPLLAPVADRSWQLLWSSDDWRYGGSGTAAPETATGWVLPPESLLVLAAR